MMEKNSVISESESRAIASQKLGGLGTFLRKCLFSVVSVGPIPEHIAFIMDGNRRYAKRRNLPVGEGHRAGFPSLMSILRIDNFKRRPDEVKTLMDLLREKIEGLLEKESIVNQFGNRVYFIGNLKLLNESVRVAAEKAMKATANNSKAVLLICVAYTSCDEIIHAVEESCNVKKSEIRAQINGAKGGRNGDEGEFLESEKQLPVVKVVNVEKHLYMSVAPDPDILIRTSGETRLSNFLLWQTSNCPLYSPAALWPDLGLWHLVWAILNFQRNDNYLEKKRKQM
ncbi:hypothetical protein ACFX1X_027117 [Malus domestica]